MNNITAPSLLHFGCSGGDVMGILSFDSIIFEIYFSQLNIANKDACTHVRVLVGNLNFD